MSKRHLKLLVDENHVNNWDDPRMPTVSGLRRKAILQMPLGNLFIV